LRPGVVAVSTPGDTTARITIRSDGTATTTFIGERLVVEFDTPFGPDPSSTVDGEHGVKGDAPRPRSDAQPDGGYPVETADWRVLVVRVRQDRSGTPYWQLNTTPATPRVEELLWRRPDDDQQAAHDELRIGVGIGLATRSALTTPNRSESTEHEHQSAGPAVAELVARPAVKRPTVRRARPGRRATPARPRSTDAATDSRANRIVDRFAHGRNRNRATMSRSQEHRSGRTRTDVRQMAVTAQANRRPYLPIVFIAVAVLCFVGGALTTSAQTRPQATTTRNTTPAASIRPVVTAGPATIPVRATGVNVYDLAIVGAEPGATHQGPAANRTTGVNVYDLAITGAHTMPGSTKLVRRS
jgi:hypothetical protein